MLVIPAMGQHPIATGEICIVVRAIVRLGEGAVIRSGYFQFRGQKEPWRDRFSIVFNEYLRRLATERFINQAVRRTRLRSSIPVFLSFRGPTLRDGDSTGLSRLEMMVKFLSCGSSRDSTVQFCNELGVLDELRR